MKRPLLALGTAALVAVVLSGCADKSRSGFDVRATPTTTASPTTSAEGNLGGMARQANQLAQTLPQFSPLTAAPSETGSVAPTSTGLDSCALVSPDLLLQDFDITLTTAAMPQPSSFHDPDANDCLYGDASSLVAVEATTHADQDAPASSYDITGVPNSAPVPGADRGYVWVPDPTATSGAANVFVVVGQQALNVVVTAASPISVEQATTFGQDLAAELAG